MPKRCTTCGKKESVEINRKRYCAHCGEVLVTAQTATKAKASPEPRRAAPAKSSPAKAKASAAHLLDLSKSRHKSGRLSAQNIHGERRNPTPPKATTPDLKPKKAERHQARLERARAVAKHATIKRFASTTQNPAQSPSGAAAKVTAHTMTPHKTYQLSEAAQTKADQALKVKKSGRLKFKKPQNPLRKSKRNSRPRLRRPNLVPALAVAGIVLLLGGYITYLNVPTLGLRIAASRAGIDAQLPNYKPASYAFSGVVGYRPGQITLRFSSDRADEYLDLTQRQTQWDPPTLLENYVVPKSAHYISFNQNGLTIYVYNGNNAAWINNGIFYTIEGNSELNQDQVLKMAASF